MDDREAQHNRLTNHKSSKATKLAWKRHHDSFMRGIRKRERNKMNKTFYSISKELEECLSSLKEAEQVKNDVFNLEYGLEFDKVSGGISFNINKEDGSVSISTSLNEGGRGSYKLVNPPVDETGYKNLFEELKDEFQYIASTLDDSVKQILAKHGISET